MSTLSRKLAGYLIPIHHSASDSTMCSNTGVCSGMSKQKIMFNMYRQVSNIRRTKSQHLKGLVLSCGCLCRIPWSQMCSREWRCRWSSADRRCSNYIWVIDNFIAYQGASYIRGFTVLCFVPNHWKPLIFVSPCVSLKDGLIGPWDIWMKF